MKKKFTDRIAQKEESIIVDVEQLPAVARSGVRRNVYRRSRIGTLGNFRGKSRGKHSRGRLSMGNLFLLRLSGNPNAGGYFLLRNSH